MKMENHSSLAKSDLPSIPVREDEESKTEAKQNLKQDDDFEPLD